MNIPLVITQVSASHIQQGFLTQGHKNYTKI